MSSSGPRHPRPVTSHRARLGLPIAAVLGLALLAIPRAVLHDLDVIEGGTLLNALLVYVPPAIWIAVILAKRVARPFGALVAIGICYGIMLAIAHQVLWDANVGDDPPQLGGNLSDLDPGVETAIIRSFAALSSLATGAFVGVVAGLIGWGLTRVFGRTS